MKVIDIALDQTHGRKDNAVNQLIDGLPVAVYTCNNEGYITQFNEAAARLWGRTPELNKEQWCGAHTIFETDGVTPVPFDTCPMALALRTGKPVEGREILIERPDGSRRNVIPHPRPLFDEDGQIAGAYNMLLDVTETRIADEHNAMLASLVRSSDDAVISKTLNSIVTSWNAAATRIFGYTAEEMIGQPITLLIPEERASEESEIIERISKGEHVDHFETVRQAKDGRRIDISLTISPIKNSEGKIIGVSKIARDISEQKYLNNALRESERKYRELSEELEQRVRLRTMQLYESNEQLGRSNRELEQYAYTASHDLQEPLRKVQTLTGLLSMRIKDNIDDKALECLEKITTATSRMSKLINDLLNFSRITLNEGQESKVVDLNEVVTQVRGDIELLITKKDAVIECGVLPVVKAVPLHMRQLFYNLLVNALKFSKEGQQPVVKLNARLLSEEEKQLLNVPELHSNYHEITVSDNGIGFDPAYEKSIFEIFNRLNTREKYEGTGIGLALCKKIVTSMNGLIYANSSEGEGATFHILLPV